FGNVQGELWLCEPPKPSLRKLGTCPGLVRRVLARDSERILVLCSNQEQTHFTALELGLSEIRDPVTLWNEAASAAEFEPSGLRMAAATGEGISGFAEAGQEPPQLSLPPTRRVSALAWLGADLILGTQSGELLLVQRDARRWSIAKSAQSQSGPVRKLLVAAKGGHFVSFGEDGKAALYSAELERLAELPVASKVAYFLDDYAAVALVSAQHRIAILSTIDGRKLGEFASVTGELSALSGNGDWLFASSLDGSTRAWPLDTTLPRRRMSPLHQDETGRCALALDGSALACLNDDRLSTAPMPGQAGAARSFVLGAAQRPDPGAIPAVGAGASHVAWRAGPGRVVAWDGTRFSEYASAGSVSSVSATPEPGVWLLLRQNGEQRKLSVAGRSDAAPSEVTLSFTPKLVAFADGGRSFLLDTEGKLYEGRALDGPYENVRSPQGGQDVTAMAIAPGGERIAFGTAHGGLSWLEPGSGRSAPFGNLGAAVNAMTFTREERAVVVSDAAGGVTLFDIETATATPLFGIAGLAASSALDAATGWIGFGTVRGDLWRQA
ncbi:MAG TPA: hypothetical protein VGP93_15840, partial [Polyangiaceae bacterium]|nr:hypothetical protein [Polyangiaceae bacterium]